MSPFAPLRRPAASRRAFPLPQLRPGVLLGFLALLPAGRTEEIDALAAQDDAFVVWKVRLFALGAALALVGMASTRRWLVWAGIAALAAGLALRFAPRHN